MILLLDHVRTKRAALPDDVARCRMVVPSDGLVSVSLWDTTDAAALKAIAAMAAPPPPPAPGLPAGVPLPQGFPIPLPVR